MKYTENPLLKKNIEYDNDLSTCILDDFYERYKCNSSDSYVTAASNDENKNKNYNCFYYYFCCFR
jgi:hypothetical protein